MSSEADVDVEALADRVEQLEEDLAEERAARREAEARADGLEARVDELEERVDDRAAVRWDDAAAEEIVVESTEGSRYPLGRAVAAKAPAREVEDLEERVDDLEAGDVDVDQEAEPPEPAVERETPLEEIVAMPEPVAEENLTPNQGRARFVARDVRQYTEGVPAGRAIAASELRRVVVAGTDASGHGETVGRIIGFLDELGGDDVRVVERRGERRVVFDEQLVERLGRITAGVDAGASHTGVTRGEA